MNRFRLQTPGSLSITLPGHSYEVYGRFETLDSFLLFNRMGHPSEVTYSLTLSNISLILCMQARSIPSIEQQRPLQLERVRVASCVHAAAQGAQDQILNS